MMKHKATKRDVKEWSDEYTKLQKLSHKANQKARNQRIRKIANELEDRGELHSSKARNQRIRKIANEIEDRGELHSSKANNLRKGNATKRTIAAWEAELRPLTQTISKDPNGAFSTYRKQKTTL